MNLRPIQKVWKIKTNKTLARVTLALRPPLVATRRRSFNRPSLLLLQTTLLAFGFLLITSLIRQRYVLVLQSKPKQFCIHNNGLICFVIFNYRIILRFRMLLPSTFPTTIFRSPRRTTKWNFRRALLTLMWTRTWINRCKTVIGQIMNMTKSVHSITQTCFSYNEMLVLS